MATSKHPGFKAIQAKIMGTEGVDKKRAGAMLASSTRKSSEAAKRRNPRLRRVRGR